VADLTDAQIDRIWHRLGSFSPNDHRTFARQVLREVEQQRLGQESTAFNEWWDANQQDPQHTMIVRNAAAAAWQERARRAHDASVALPRAPLTDQQIVDLVPDDQAGWSRGQYCQWMARAVERAHGIGTSGVPEPAAPSDTARLNVVLDTFGKREDNMPLTAAERALVEAFDDRGSYTKDMKLRCIDDAVRALGVGVAGSKTPAPTPAAVAVSHPPRDSGKDASNG
jgi:hypothetical protein